MCSRDKNSLLIVTIMSLVIDKKMQPQLVVYGIVGLMIVGIVLYYTNWLVEKFYNIMPTELIDRSYYNINEDPYNYYDKLRVGDIHGVDLNCNNVTMNNILKWIEDNDSDVLYKYVYIYDPSVNIYNPVDAPRVFKMLLMNLPEKHPYLPIVRKCFPSKVKIA